MKSKVLDIVKEMKLKLVEMGKEVTYGYANGETCIERWVKELNDPTYNQMFSSIQSSQKDELVLLRYARYSDVFGGEEPIDYEEFWYSYDGFYRECRSIVIDVILEALVIVPYDKFFNLNEGEETSFESVMKRINEAKVVEISNKLDGSMQCASFYNGRIVMAGSQAIDPECSWRLKDGLRMLDDDPNYGSLIRWNADKTFIFEFISLDDAHVVNYTKEQEGLYLIGVRDNKTGETYSYREVLKIAESYGIKTTELFDKTLEQIVTELDDVKSNEAEGFVLNIDGFRVKIKYNDYCGIHRILSSISSINLIIKNIADDTFDDLISKVPDAYRWRIDKVAKIVWAHINACHYETKEYYKQISSLPIKDAMIWIDTNVPRLFRGYVVSMYKGKDVNYVRSTSGRYKKLNEMGVNSSEYKDLFVNDESDS